MNVISEPPGKMPSDACGRARCATMRSGPADAKIDFSIGKIRPTGGLPAGSGFGAARHRLADRIFAFALSSHARYGDIMSTVRGPMIGPDGMIAAIVRSNGGRLARRNPADLAATSAGFLNRLC